MKSAKNTNARLIMANGFVAVLLLICLYFTLTTRSSFNLITSTVFVCKCWLALLLCLAFAVNVFTFGIPPLKIRSAVRGVLSCVFAAFFFHITAVLFGSPFAEKVAETFHFAMVLTATTVVPVCLLKDSDTGIVTLLHKLSSGKLGLGPESVAGVTAGCSVLGAWLGAFPIPLDWDRPWQVWPISCVVGNLLGYILGLVVSGVHYTHQYRALQKIKIT